MEKGVMLQYSDKKAGHRAVFMARSQLKKAECIDKNPGRKQKTF